MAVIAAEPTPNTVDALAQLSFLVQDALARRAAAHGLSTILARLLGVLRDREPTMGELARLLGLDKSSVSGLVGRAEARGLVERVPSQADRRAATVRLTADGKSLVAAAAADFGNDVAAMLEGLSAGQMEKLTGLSAAILRRDAAARGLAVPD